MFDTVKLYSSCISGVAQTILSLEINFNPGLGMNKKKQSTLVGLSLMLALSACNSPLVYNPDCPNSGPLFVEPTTPEPVPEPVVVAQPEPEPIPEPSISELNARAIASFTDAGLEAEQTDRGVNVYLPPDIFFSGATAKIDLDARGKIAQIAAEVNKDYLQQRQIEIVGHTDSSGLAETNLALSKKRATSAAGELVFSRVGEKRLIVKWKGETEPRYPEVLADGTPDYKGRARNRRVEFTILNPDES